MSSQSESMPPQGMPQNTPTRPRVAVVCRPDEQNGAMARLFRRMVGQVEFTGAVPTLEAADRYALVVVHYDQLGPSDRRAVAAHFGSRTGPPLVLLSKELDHTDLASLFGARVLTNLVCSGESGPDLSDLLVTLQKLGHDEIFGLEKYFPWGTPLQKALVASCDDRDFIINTVETYAAEREVPRRLRQLVRCVMDEFLSNALFNAPTMPDGSPRFPRRPRTDPVQLRPGEMIEVRYCCDGRRFGLSASDPFGSLSPNVVMDNLARAFRGGDDQMRDHGGAGLGFFQMYDSLSHLVVNIEPGRKTEMIGLIDVSGGYRSFVKGGTSFNIFVAEGNHEPLLDPEP